MGYTVVEKAFISHSLTFVKIMHVNNIQHTKKWFWLDKLNESPS